MKRFFLILWAAVLAMGMSAASYGILVNGKTYFAGEKVDEFEGFQQYLAHVAVKSGDYCQLYDYDNKASWAVNMSEYSVEGFTRNDDRYEVTKDGCFDFYIKLKYEQDELYVGGGSDCGEGVDISGGETPDPDPDPQPECEEFGLLIDGEYTAAVKNDAQGEWLEYMLLGVELTEGQYVQIYDKCHEAAWVIEKYASTSYEFAIEDGKYKVTESGKYDFYLKFIFEADEIYIAKEGDTPGPQPECEEFGLLIDGEYKAGVKNEAQTEWLEYMLLGVELTEGQFVQIYDKCHEAAWVIEKYASTSYEFAIEDGKYKVTESGKYDFYLKFIFEADEIYIAKEGDTPGPQPGCEEFGLLIDGEYKAGVKNEAQTEWLEYMLLGVELTEGQFVQIYDKCHEAAWVISKYAETSYEFAIEDGKYKVTESGKYDFYIKFIFEADEIYIAKDGWTPKPANSVPGQCTDVLLQGFYYDSYKDDEPERGTDIYGNTRWKTLLGQAGEIGAYFDLIWLPPSGYASGTGYHPRQYSNQNSDWGSRSDLEKLIAAFHNSGTKVVADMVVNHLEAMSSWCDFAVQDFGEYGKFEPDGSWICNTDEMNMPGCKEDAGECWGTATGPADDGPTYDGKNEANYAAARDLAHDSEKVREMCRAYAKWLINVMHYDGFRYDYCKGFHASHIGDYNKAGGAYISFMELWASVGAIQQAISDAQGNTMSLDFPGKYDAFNNGIVAGNYMGCKGSGLLGAGMSKYAVTFVDNHDTFLRDDNEFGGFGNSMKPELKDKLLQANAFMLGMPGVPCVFYPHWVAHKEAIKAMINARHLAGVHSESPVTDEEAEQGGYKCTVQGKNGYLILCLGNKAGNDYAAYGYKKIASGNGYAMWVNTDKDVAPGLIVTPSSSFEDKENGITVTIEAVGGSGNAKIYYTTDGSEPTTESAVYTEPLNFKETTTLKVMGVCGNAKSGVQTYTYTYREPLQHGIRVRFNKPAEWEKVYVYAWNPGVDEQGNPTSENIMGAYPGQRIYQDAEGWFSYEFDASLKTVHFCINSGDDCGGVNVRSNDLEIDYDKCYGWREGKETDSSEEEELECDIDLAPAFDLVIAPESGFFRDLDEGQEVTIRAIGAENAMIYYTTDGTEPSTASETGQGEVTFTVKETTTVKAFAALDKERTETYSATYTYKAPQQGALTVRFMKPEEWETLYLYAFTRVKVGNKYKDTAYALDGNAAYKKWPGMPWTTMDGDWYTYTMPEDIKEIYVIFTEGNNKPQTQDIFLTEDACYVWNPDCWRAVLDPECEGSFIQGIEDVETPAFDASQPIYNVLGQQVSADYIGIVIQNGHKYLIAR